MALVLTPAALLLATAVYFSIVQPPQTSGAVGWDTVSLFHWVPVVGLVRDGTPLIALVLLIFAVGFYWQFRRHSRKVTIP